MKKIIYKIENLINHKIYIGQTNNYHRRVTEHKAKNYKRDSNKVLYRAFDKYGIDNFSFEIIEEVENYNERETYWIQYYNCRTPNGYNETDGGENPPVFHKEEHPMATHTQKDVDNIIYLLKETQTSTRDIAKITGYNTSSINRINVGDLWFDENLDYPLRKLQSHKGKLERANQIIYDLLNTNLTQKEIGKKYGVGRTTITAINNGQNFHRDDIQYPIRK